MLGCYRFATLAVQQLFMRGFVTLAVPWLNSGLHASVPAGYTILHVKSVCTSAATLSLRTIHE
jgi:hypothetical protein